MMISRQSDSVNSPLASISVSSATPRVARFLASMRKSSSIAEPPMVAQWSWDGVNGGPAICRHSLLRRSTGFDVLADPHEMGVSCAMLAEDDVA
jgi:hypothetical protein